MTADISHLAAVAAKKVAGIESLGVADGQRLAAAEVAIEAVLRAAEAALLPRQIPRLGADAIAAYEAFAARVSSIEGLAELHERSLASFPELAVACRSLAVLDVEVFATQTATRSSELETLAAAGDRARTVARRRYLRLIASAIAGLADQELAPAARALLEAEGLAARLAAARQRLEEPAAAEVATDVEAQRDAMRRREADAARLERAAALIQRLRASGLKSLRSGPHYDNTRHDVQNLIGAARGMSLEQLAHWERALDMSEGGS